MDDVVIWAEDRCSRSRGAEALLAERGVVPAVVRYLETPPDLAELERVVAAAGPDALRDALAAHPELIERPVVLRGDRAVVPRPPERLLVLLDGD